MIASLRGRVIGKTKDAAIIEVGGVGFRVTVPQRTLRQWDAGAGEVRVLTHLQVRENDLALYGCETDEEMALFRLLLTVDGVGPKMAMAILSECPAATLSGIIAREDVEALSRVPGVGPKTGRKIAFHLKDKVAREQAGPASSDEVALPVDAEIVAALVSLGYNQLEARAAVAALPAEAREFEERLRLALRYFAR